MQPRAFPSAALPSRHPPHVLVLYGVALLGCLLAACGDDGRDGADVDASQADADTTPSTPLPADVDDVLTRRCRECHTNPPDNIAPFALLDWEDTQAQAIGYPKGTPIYEVMQLRIHDPEFPMPPAKREMTDADRKVIDTWIDAGALAAPTR